MADYSNIERKIVIGLITSDSYTKQIRQDIFPKLFQSASARTIATWCLEYFDAHGKSPQMDIESIYYEKLRTGKIPKEIAEEFEEELLPGLSTEYEDEGIDVNYLIQISHTYFQERGLILLASGLENLVAKGELEQASALIQEYRETIPQEDEISLEDGSTIEAVKEALEQTYEPLIEFSGALGKMWNSQMVKGGFVAFLAPEKRCKSMILLDIAKRGLRQGKKIAFFQAGDMSRNQQLRRIAINISGRVIDEKYMGNQLIPVKDCVKNQLNLCSKRIRECSYGVFEDRGWDEKTLKDEISIEDVKDAHKDFPEYQPCHNCKEYQTQALGAVWMQQEKIKQLTIPTAQKIWKQFFTKYKAGFRLSTHANGTLTIQKIERILESWKVRDNFVPDIIVLDYADLVELEQYREERHKQNQVWKSLRGISQKLDCLLITATQADANSYEQDTLQLKNYSEDKRKYAHVTAMYGLNWDKKGREKNLRIMRINELILREDEFNATNTVTVLQALFVYRSLLDSYR